MNDFIKSIAHHLGSIWLLMFLYLFICIMMLDPPNWLEALLVVSFVSGGWIMCLVICWRTRKDKP